MGVAAGTTLVLFEVVGNMIEGWLQVTIKTEDSGLYPALDATLNVLLKDIITV